MREKESSEGRVDRIGKGREEGDKDSKCWRERCEGLREGERKGDEEVIRDMKRSYREVSGGAVPGEYKIDLVTSFDSRGGKERVREGRKLVKLVSQILTSLGVEVTEKHKLGPSNIHLGEISKAVPPPVLAGLVWLCG